MDGGNGMTVCLLVIWLVFGVLSWELGSLGNGTLGTSQTEKARFSINIRGSHYAYSAKRNGIWTVESLFTSRGPGPWWVS